MPETRLRRLASSWIAIAAMLLAALAPSVSQALRHDAAPGWIEICSASHDGPSGPQPASDGHAFEHCAYCSMHAATLGLPPLPWAMSAASPRRSAAPPSPAPALHAHGAWPAAQARAPPRLS